MLTLDHVTVSMSSDMFRIVRCLAGSTVIIVNIRSFYFNDRMSVCVSWVRSKKLKFELFFCELVIVPKFSPFRFVDIIFLVQVNECYLETRKFIYLFNLPVLFWWILEHLEFVAISLLLHPNRSWSPPLDSVYQMKFGHKYSPLICHRRNLKSLEFPDVSKRVMKNICEHHTRRHFFYL